MVARPPELDDTVPEDVPEDGWLTAGEIRLDDERDAVLAFDRFGTAKLTLRLDRRVRGDDVDALERAADLLPQLRLDDLDGTDFPRRHASVFGRKLPLQEASFGRVYLVEVIAPEGGVRIPRRLGLFGFPAYQVAVVDVALDMPGDPSGAEARTLVGAGVVPDGTAGGASDAPATAEPAPAGGETGGDAPGPVALGTLAPGTATPGGVPTGVPTAGRPGVRPAPAGGPVRRLAGTALDRFDAALGAVGGSLVDVTRLPAAVLCRAVLVLALAGFVATFTLQTWTAHARFGTYGFDVGIFDQGTWLLSQLHSPFVTIRGLNLFGDHASYILVLVAPLYWIWADPRLLLLLQVFGLAAPAVALYVVAARRFANPAAGLAIAVAYLAYPAMQWAATWQFHPETLAAGFLAGAVVAADARRDRLLVVCVALALLCKEDVGLVVAGFGVMLWLNGDPRRGKRLAVAGLGWFLITTFALIPLVSRAGSPHFALNYGIRDDSLVTALASLPKLTLQAISFALTNNGLRYLLLIFVPLALLPLASWRSLAPVAGPIALNLAATHPYQHEIRYHYLAVSSLFLVLAAAAGIAALTARRRSLLGALCLVLLLAVGVSDYLYGPAPWSKTPSLGTEPASAAARYEALARVDDGGGVSAQFHLISHLAERKDAYEFPNPFIPYNWGHTGDRPDPAAIPAIKWIVVEPALLNTASDIDRQGSDLVNRLRQDPEWDTVYDNGGVLVLHRTGGAGSPSPPTTLQERP
jgi:uncharacterized membrane protein